VRRGENIVIPLESLLPELPGVPLPAPLAAQAAHGRDIEIACDRDRVRLLDEADRLVAIAARAGGKPGNLFHPLVVLSKAGDAKPTD